MRSIAGRSRATEGLAPNDRGIQWGVSRPREDRPDGDVHDAVAVKVHDHDQVNVNDDDRSRFAEGVVLDENLAAGVFGVRK